MFSFCTFAIFALLAVAAAGSTTDRPTDGLALGPDFKETFPSRRSIWDHYDKESKDAPAEKILYYKNILEQCRVEVTDKNYRVIINVEATKKDDLRVILKNNFMIAVKTGYEEFNDAIQNKRILNKLTFTEVRSIPADSVVASVTATVTSDGYLVVDFPIDAKAAEPALGEREVPVVESGKPLEGGKVTTKQPTLKKNYEAYVYVTYTLLFKVLAKYFKVESKIETIDNSFRVILKVVNATNITKDDLKVELSGGFLYIYSNYTAVENRLTNFVCDSFILPRNTVVASVTATLTSDDYLVVDIPIDAQVEELALGRRDVPVVECGKPLEKWKASTAASDSEEVTGNDYDIDSESKPMRRYSTLM